MSTNPQRDAEKPGTSASFMRQNSPNENEREQLDLNIETDSEPVSNESSAKVRNASRDRPPTDRHESKRFRAAEDDIDVHMETESSGEETEVDEEDEDVNVENEDDSEHSDADELVPVQDAPIYIRRRANERMSASTSRRHSSHYPEQAQFQRSYPEYARHLPYAHEFAPPVYGLGHPPEFLPREFHEMHNRNAYYYGDDHNYAAPMMNEMENLNPPPVPSDEPGSRKTTVYGIEYEHGCNWYKVRHPPEKVEDNTRLMVARKIFLLSTELVFPGIISYDENKWHIPKNYMGNQVRSSLWLQILLRTDQLFFVLWILSFLLTSDILTFILKELHGYLAMCLTCLFVLIHIIRIRFGLKGNETDEVQCLALYWMITVIVQIPLFSFILLTHLFAPVLMAFNVTMDGFMLLFIIVESMVGFKHFRRLLDCELNVIQMLRRHKEAHALWLQSLNVQYQEDLAGQGGHMEEEHWAPYDEDVHPVDNDSDYEYEHNPMERMDFQMQIRHLPEQRPVIAHDDDGNDSDSSEQVTSTSDATRQRPIRAH